METKPHPAVDKLSVVQRQKLEQDLIAYLITQGWSIVKHPTHMNNVTHTLEVINPQGVRWLQTLPDYCDYLFAVVAEELYAKVDGTFSSRHFLSERGYTFENVWMGFYFRRCVYDPEKRVVAENTTSTIWQEITLVGELLAWEKFVDGD